MPYNPCGRVVDFARREYKTKCRFFRDSDTEVEIQWYRAADDAPSLPFPSAVMSLDWLDNGYDEPWLGEVGEVWGEPRPYSFKGTPVGLTYDHICGTEEDFAEGAVFDPDREVKYDEQGLPLCCGVPRAPQMGLVVGLEVSTGELIVPAAFCSSATPVDHDVVYLLDCRVGLFHWLKLPADDAANPTYFYSNVLEVNPGNNLPQKLVGFNCASLINSFLEPVAPGVWFYGTPGGADAYMFFVGVYPEVFSARFSLFPPP